MDVAKALVKWLVWLLNQHQNLTSLKIVAYFRLLIFHNVCTTYHNFQANDVSGNTMAEAISTNETVANDDITMDDTETSNENQKH